MRAEGGLLDGSRFGVFKGRVSGRGWAQHRTLGLSGVCIWLRDPSAKLLPNLNENA